MYIKTSYSSNVKTYAQIFSYRQMLTLNLIETLTITNYSLKHTRNTRLHLNFPQVSTHTNNLTTKKKQIFTNPDMCAYFSWHH